MRLLDVSNELKVTRELELSAASSKARPKQLYEFKEYMKS